MAVRQSRLNMICIDGSRHSERAFAWYHEHYHRAGDTIGLLHLYYAPNLGNLFTQQSDQVGFSYQKEIQELVQQAKKVTETFRLRCIDFNIPNDFIKIYTESVTDSVGKTISRVATEKNAGVLVMSQHGVLVTGDARNEPTAEAAQYAPFNIQIPTLLVPDAPNFPPSGRPAINNGAEFQQKAGGGPIRGDQRPDSRFNPVQAPGSSRRDDFRNDAGIMGAGPLPGYQNITAANLMAAAQQQLVNPGAAAAAGILSQIGVPLGGPFVPGGPLGPAGPIQVPLGAGPLRPGGPIGGPRPFGPGGGPPMDGPGPRRPPPKDNRPPPAGVGPGPYVIFMWSGESMLRERVFNMFSEFGEVTKVDTQPEKGISFVHMPCYWNADKAIRNLNDIMPNGHHRKLQVKFKAATRPVIISKREEADPYKKTTADVKKEDGKGWEEI